MKTKSTESREQANATTEPEAEKPERREKPGADSLVDDNPLICRGID